MTVVARADSLEAELNAKGEDGVESRDRFVQWAQQTEGCGLLRWSGLPAVKDCHALASIQAP